MTKEEVREVIKNNRSVKARVAAVKGLAEWFGTGYDNYRVGDVISRYGKTYVQLSGNKGKFHYAFFVEVEE